MNLTLAITFEGHISIETVCLTPIRNFAIPSKISQDHKRVCLRDNNGPACHIWSCPRRSHEFISLGDWLSGKWVFAERPSSIIPRRQLTTRTPETERNIITHCFHCDENQCPQGENLLREVIFSLWLSYKNTQSLMIDSIPTHNTFGNLLNFHFFLPFYLKIYSSSFLFYFHFYPAILLGNSFIIPFSDMVRSTRRESTSQSYFLSVTILSEYPEPDDWDSHLHYFLNFFVFQENSRKKFAILTCTIKFFYWR